MRYYVCTILTPLYALREAPFVTCRTAIAKLDRGQKRLLEWAEDINRIFENRKNLRCPTLAGSSFVAQNEIQGIQGCQQHLTMIKDSI